MSVVIRLARAGTKKRPVYHVVVADSRFPRDGRFIERLGHFNPLLPKDNAERLKLDMDKVKAWLAKGAQPSDRVTRFLDAAGVMKREKRKVSPALLGLFGARAWIDYQPKGTVGVISPWNFPFNLTFTPLAGIFAAGNRAMIKPSELTPAFSQALAECVVKVFARDEVAVVTATHNPRDRERSFELLAEAFGLRAHRKAA